MKKMINSFSNNCTYIFISNNISNNIKHSQHTQVWSPLVPVHLSFLPIPRTFVHVFTRIYFRGRVRGILATCNLSTLALSPLNHRSPPTTIKFPRTVKTEPPKSCNDNVGSATFHRYPTSTVRNYRRSKERFDDESLWKRAGGKETRAGCEIRRFRINNCVLSEMIRAAWMWSSLRLIQRREKFCFCSYESNDTRWNNLNGGFARFENNGIWGNFFFAKIGREELFI